MHRIVVARSQALREFLGATREIASEDSISQSVVSRFLRAAVAVPLQSLFIVSSVAARLPHAIATASIRRCAALGSCTDESAVRALQRTCEGLTETYRAR